ncbi:MAG: polysaccharide export protein [Halioglobus sp.]|nr:polysaccharide export protein [Halioglobus sp.]
MPHLFRHFLQLMFLIAVPMASLAQGNAGSASYTLNTGDHVQITVFEEPDLNLSAVLDDTGSISYPLLGELKVSGMTLRQLESEITEGLRGRFLINPRVNVSIKEYRPFFVRGEVNNPGEYAFKPGLTVEKAVSLAGGFTSRASKSKFYIVSDDSLEETGEVRRPAALTSRIRPGDVVNIEQSFF